MKDDSPPQKQVLFNTRLDGTILLKSAAPGTVERRAVQWLAEATAKHEPPYRSEVAIETWNGLENGTRSSDTVWVHLSRRDPTRADYILTIPQDMTFEEFLQDPDVKQLS
jgi:hypothetical protein